MGPSAPDLPPDRRQKAVVERLAQQARRGKSMRSGKYGVFLYEQWRANVFKESHMALLVPKKGSSWIGSGRSTQRLQAESSASRSVRDRHSSARRSQAAACRETIARDGRLSAQGDDCKSGDSSDSLMLGGPIAAWRKRPRRDGGVMIAMERGGTHGNVKLDLARSESSTTSCTWPGFLETTYASRAAPG